MRSKYAAYVAVLALIGALVPIHSAGADNHVYEVVAGAYLNGKADKQVSHRFYPGDVDVNQGDVLSFSAVGKRSVALLPLGYEPAEWLAEFSTPAESPWAALIADPDEGAGFSKLNPKVGFASDPYCGTPEAPCVFDGSGNGEDGVLNSGLPLVTPLDFNVEIQAPVGQSVWVLDLMTPTMSMKVDVVAEGSESDQADLLADAQQQFSAEQDKAKSLHSQYAKKKVKKTKGGKTTWTAWAGIDDGTISLRYMYPLKLVIKKNHLVRWKFNKLLHGVRTVTFPKSRSAQLSNGYPQIVCDLDGDEGTSPDVDPQLGTAPYCVDPRDVELDVSQEILARSGDGKYKAGKDFETSGVRGAGYASDVKDYVLKFPKVSSKKGFKYASIVHMYAVGTVVVKS